MKQTIKNVTAIAILTFTLSFVTGLSASLIYQEHQSLKPIIAAQQMISEESIVLYADASSDNNVF